MGQPSVLLKDGHIQMLAINSSHEIQNDRIVYERVKRVFDIIFSLIGIIICIPLMIIFAILIRLHSNEQIIYRLPQLFNILKGDMSIIGPCAMSPTLICELEEQIPGFRNRLCVKPGFIGCAQVNVGYRNTFKAMHLIEMNYVHNRDFIMEIIIFFETIKMFLHHKIRKSL